MSIFVQRLQSISLERRSYLLRNFPSELAEAGEIKRLGDLLTFFDFLQAKLDAFGPQSLADDYRLAFGSAIHSESPFRLVHAAILLSAHILTQDTTQLSGQLIGRLLDYQMPEIQSLLNSARHWKAAPWLRPLTANLLSPGGPLLNTLSGHSSRIEAIAVTPDGRQVISASRDHTLKVWNIEDGREMFTLQGHHEAVHGVAVTSDAKYVVSASSDKTLKVWNLENRTELMTLHGHTGPVQAVAITPDSRHIISAAGNQWQAQSPDTTVKVWDLKRGTELMTLSGHTESIQVVAVTPDGKQAISAAGNMWLRSSEHILKVWDLESGAERWTLRGHTGPINGVTVTPDGGYAISVGGPAGYESVFSTSNNVLKIWDLKRGIELFTIQGQHGSIEAVAALPDGQHIISGSSDSKLTMWNIKKGEEIFSLQDTNTIFALAVSPDGRRVLSGSSNTLKVWDMGKAIQLFSPSLHHEHNAIRAMAVMSAGQRIVSLDTANTLRVWDLETRTELQTLPGHVSDIQNERASLAVTADSRFVISTSGRDVIKVWDLERGSEVQIISEYRGSAYERGAHETFVEAYSLARRSGSQINPELLEAAHRENLALLDAEILGIAMLDSNHFLTVTRALTLKIWDLESRKELKIWHQNFSVSRHVALSMAVIPGGQRIIAGYLAYHLVDPHNVEVSPISVWDLETGEEILHLSGHNGPVFAVAATPDGRYAISGAKATLKVWDLEQGVETLTLSGHSDIILAVAVTPDGRYFVSGSLDCTLKVWDLKRERIIASFTADSAIGACMVAPDGGTVIAGDNDGRVHFFRLEVPGMENKDRAK